MRALISRIRNDDTEIAFAIALIISLLIVAAAFVLVAVVI